MARTMSVTDLSRRDRHGMSRPDRDSVTSPFRGCHAVTLAEAPAALDELANRVRRLVPSHRDPEAFHEAKSEIEADLRRLARVLPAEDVCGRRKRLSSLDEARLSAKVPGLRKG